MHSFKSIACALGLLAASCTASGGQQPATATAAELPNAGEPEAAEQSCWKDSECTLVDDCCGCGRGGLRMGIRGDRLNTLVERSAAACEQHSCADRPSQHRSCTASAARCAGGRCIPAL
jgi:hypothetical protein